MDIELLSWWPLLLVAIAAGSEALLAFLQPPAAAAAAALLLPAYLLRIRVTPLPTNALELLVLGFFLGYALRALVLHKRFTFPLRPRAFWAALAVIALGAVFGTLNALRVSGIESESARLALGALKGFVVEPVLFVLFLSGIAAVWPKAFPIALRGYVFGAALVAAAALGGGLIAIFTHCVGEALPCAILTFDGRLRFLYRSPNELAMYLLPAAVLALGIGDWGLGIGRRVRWVVLALFFGVLLWTQSLGALVAAAAGLFFLFALRYRRRAAEWVAYAAVAISALVPFASVALSDFLIRDGERSSFASRVMIWRSAITLARENWFFGIGPGLFQTHYLALQERFPPYLEWAVPQPHNLFLAMWLGAGLVGLAAFLWLLVVAFRQARLQSTSPLTGAALAVVVALTVAGSVDTPFWKNDISITFLLALSVALLPAIEAPDENERDRPMRRPRA